MSVRQKVLKVWVVEGIHPSGNVVFLLSEDKQYWDGFTIPSTIDNSEVGDLHIWKLKIDAKHRYPGWNNVRKHAIKYLMPQVQVLPPEPVELPKPYFRFKDLEL